MQKITPSFLEKDRVKKIQAIAKSSYDQFCESPKDNHYILGVNYAIAVIPTQFSQNGSKNLDQILAFDTAEITGANLGQTNLITVSSFCGPSGVIWGYDICHEPLQELPKLSQNLSIPQV